jgi:hypothetical protein
MKADSVSGASVTPKVTSPPLSVELSGEAKEKEENVAVIFSYQVCHKVFEIGMVVSAFGASAMARYSKSIENGSAFIKSKLIVCIPHDSSVPALFKLVVIFRVRDELECANVKLTELTFSFHLDEDEPHTLVLPSCL